MPFAIITAFCPHCNERIRIKKIDFSSMQNSISIKLLCGHSFSIKNIKFDWGG